MVGTTDHYGLSQIGGGDTFQADGYKYTYADRQTIDNLLWLGAEGHKHTGEAGSIVEPDTGPLLTLSTTGGTIPAGTRVYYKYTYVNSRGEESIASPESYVDTPSPIAEPSAPTLSYSTTGGVLSGGNYFYVLSAYVNASISESKALNPAFISIPATTVTNVVELTFPSLPSGATGYNIYRRAPGQAKYYFLASVDLNVATPPTTYVDDGSVEEDCDRGLPRFNTTNATNSITIELPDPLETGYTWRIYRTYVTGAWASSFLVHVVEYIGEATPTITAEYLDVGISTSEGTFPLTSLLVGNPSKVLLTDGAEVQGSLPLGAIAFPQVVSFHFSGELHVAQGSGVWVCEFPAAEIVCCRASLGRGSAPASTPVIVDVNKGPASPTPSFSTIYTTQANRPTVPVGDMIGSRTTPNVTSLVRGDALTVDIDQVGGGATPTDRDLTVTIVVIAHGYPTTSYVPGSSGGAGGEF